MNNYNVTFAILIFIAIAISISGCSTIDQRQDCQKCFDEGIKFQIIVEKEKQNERRN